MRGHAARDLSEEELTVGILSGEILRCYWCGNYYKGSDAPDAPYSHICSAKCEANQFDVWQGDYARWKHTMQKHGADDEWLGLKG